MAKELLSVQDVVQQYASIMARVAGVDVEVVDDALFRVAGTGMFAAHVNEDMAAEGYAYRQVLRTGRLQVIDRPGSDAICLACPRRGNCAEELEIAMPIRGRKATIGVIGLVATTPGQRLVILHDRETYLQLVEQIASFIAAKATEQQERRREESLLSALACTINHMEQAILILGRDGTVTTANHEAHRQLHTEPIEGAAVTVTSTGDKLNGQEEYILGLPGRQVHIFGTFYTPHQGDDDYARVLVFTCSHAMKKRVYALTATVGTNTLIGSSRETQAVRAEIRKIADSRSTVLITGESGTGKEVVATSIWRAGSRSTQQFVAINCAAIPETLLEAELFGYVKGAFTGADPNGRVGKFELANQGVIFLDEIGDIPLFLQAKLLRVLQERQIVRIGSNNQIAVDVRVIAATNKDLRAMIAEGKFREDLYYRLNVIPLQLAPLRSRPADIPDLVEHFAGRYAALFGRERYTVPPETMDALRRYPWYGNVRELENTLEFMMNMSDASGVLGLDTLPRSFQEVLAAQERAAAAQPAAENGSAGMDAAGQTAPAAGDAVASAPAPAPSAGTPAAAAARGEVLPAGTPSAQAAPAGAAPGAPSAAASAPADAGAQPPLVPLRELEKRELQRALALCGATTAGKRRAAALLGISLATLYRKCEDFSL